MVENAYEIIRVWEVLALPSNKPSTRIGFTLNPEDAEKLAEGQGQDGHSGRIEEHSAIRMADGKIFLLKIDIAYKATDVNKVLAERARGKLTPAELAAIIAVNKQ